MSEVPNLDELWSMVQRMPRADQVRLARRVLASLPRSDDARAYRAHPPSPDEVGTEEDSLSWEAEGWDDLDAKR